MVKTWMGPYGIRTLGGMYLKDLRGYPDRNTLETCMGHGFKFQELQCPSWVLTGDHSSLETHNN